MGNLNKTPSNSPQSYKQAGGGLKNYVALQKINHSGVVVAIGEVLALSDNDAQFLLTAGYVREAIAGDGEPKPVPEVQVGNHADVGDGSLVEALQEQLAEKENKVNGLLASVEYQEKILDNFRQRSQARLDFINQLISERNATNALLYTKMTKDELNAELDKRKIEHDAKAKNDELEALLVANDKTFEYVEVIDSEDGETDNAGADNQDTNETDELPPQTQEQS